MGKRILQFFFCFLFLLSSNLLKAENSLTLFVATPPKKLSWKSPSSLLWSTIKSGFKSNFFSIGHAMIDLQCDATKDSGPVNEQTGVTSKQGSDDKDLIVDDGIGMGILFHTFEGELNTREFVKKRLELASELQNRLSTFKILVNEKTCQRLATYLREYKEKGIDSRYGLSLRPRRAEGSGCTAFGASFFEVAGFLSSEIKKAWSVEVDVQESLIGDPSLNKKISIDEILFSEKGQSWAKNGEPSRHLLVYDTQLFDQWIRKIWNNRSKGLPAGYSIDQKTYKKWHKRIWIEVQAPGTPEGWEEANVSNGVVSLQFDARSIPTPIDNIWIE
jgi:hypothetical protein